MKILILGNSHVACLRKAWEHSKELNLKKITSIEFIALAGKHYSDFSIKNGCLDIITDEARQFYKKTFDKDFETVKLDKYDCIVVHGAFLPFRLFEAFSLKFIDKNAYIPESTIQHCSKSYWKNNTGSKYATLISEQVQTLVLLSEQPSPAIDYNKELHIPDLMRKSFLDECERLCKANQFEFLLQPNDTLCSTHLTLMEFTNNSSRLTHSQEELHSNTDYHHMNENYGLKALQGIDKKLNSL